MIAPLVRASSVDPAGDREYASPAMRFPLAVGGRKVGRIVKTGARRLDPATCRDRDSL
jgi:hypothetical protein